VHIVILASTPEAAAEMQAALGNTADYYTVAATWTDVVSSLKDDCPDLILVERAVLARVDLSILTSLMEANRWPPVLLVSAPTASMQGEIGVVQRLTQTAPDYYQIGDLHIDTRKRRARLDERWVTLPPIQYRLLLTLARRTGEVIACQELLRLVWGYEASKAEARELVKVHIRQIRRRLGLDPEKHHYIRSVRGFGYMLISPDED
jgi:DNA-binding response OmpR family regulator